MSTPERNCLKLMQYEVERKHTTAYSTATDWLLVNVLDAVTSKYVLRPPPEKTDLPLNRTEIATLQKDIGVGYVDDSPEAKAKTNKELANTDWRAQLTAGLTSPQDFIFVSGEFRRAWIHGDLVLVHDFIGSDGKVLGTEKFRPVVFYVTFPPGTKDAELERFPQAEKLTVFGKPVSGLDQDGIIEMRALAVY